VDFGLSSVERYLPASRLVYRQNKLPKTIIYLVPEAPGTGDRGYGLTKELITTKKTIARPLDH